MARPRGRALAQQRVAKAEAREEARRHTSRRNLWIGIGVAAVLIGGLVAFVLTRPDPLEGADITTYPDLGVEHLAAGDPAPEYNSNPPTSGPHAIQPAACGIYREPVTDIQQVHTLEHGAVIVQYDPSLPEEDVERLEELARSIGDQILVAPRLGMPAPVAVTSWTTVMVLDGVDEDMINAFHLRYEDQSPEPLAVCPFQVDEAA